MVSSLEMTEVRGAASSPPVHTWLMWNSTEALEPWSNLVITNKCYFSINITL